MLSFCRAGRLFTTPATWDAIKVASDVCGRSRRGVPGARSRIAIRGFLSWDASLLLVGCQEEKERRNFTHRNHPS